MGKYAKKRLFESCSMLQQANELLQKVVNREAYNELGDLPEQCQCCAINMGNIIESYLGEGSESVHLLECYTELIYQFSCIHITDAKAYKLLEQLNECVGKLPEKINQEMSDKLEVVFLPYKAAMWDSLESVYLAAKKDPICDAYCIPIPYYDKNPDGSFGEMHYEGDQYPENIVITSWKKYQIQLRLPDVIYIHNPYDESNHVTSIAPEFYSKIIKNYTGKLVYIPYFVLEGNAMSEVFSVTPGCIFSDYVIAQTEDERKDYIDNFRKYIADKDYSNKVLAFGSPKFDKIYEMSDQNVHVPQAWIKRIKEQKPDYIVLYNSSIGEVLQSEGMDYFQKIIDLFKFCILNNVLVIWRPHPLMEATIQSMRSGYKDIYIKIKEEYNKKNMGIYDDTADMYPSIYISDLYVGDWSSLVWLYKATGKEVITFADKYVPARSQITGDIPDNDVINYLSIILKNKRDRARLRIKTTNRNAENIGRRIHKKIVSDIQNGVD